MDLGTQIIVVQVLIKVDKMKKEIESILMGVAKKYAQSLVNKGILELNDVDISFLLFFQPLLSQDS